MNQIPNTTVAGQIFTSTGQQNQGRWATQVNGVYISQTFAVYGAVPNDTFPGFFMPVPSGATVTLMEVQTVLTSGTVTVEVTQNGTGVGGLTALGVTSSASGWVDPSGTGAVSDGDFFTITTTSGSTPVSLTVSIVFMVSGIYTGPTSGGGGGGGGACGVSGVPGACGVSGVPGACGVSGVPGACGVAGVPGPTGVTGACGVAGACGIAGACGVSGTAGACGVSGVAGACGISGVAGTAGACGIAGVAGACGVSGVAGTAGACGVSGVSGVAGACGVSGVSGASGLAGGDAFNWTWSSATTATPASGVLNVNSATYSSVTDLYVNATDYPGTNVSTWIAAMAVRGTIKLFNASTPTNFIILTIATAPSLVSGVYTIAVSYVASNGTFDTTAGDTWLEYIPPGACGVSGVAGTAGACGVSGVAGTAGACGVSGIAGACGVSGTAGACGVSGVAGTAGACGVSGVAGACGVSGVSGVVGACGVSGVSGVSGAGLLPAAATSASGAINTTETVLETLTVVAGVTLAAGTLVRIVLQGTCTATAADTSTFTVRAGTAGTTSDASVAAMTLTSATSGTSVPFKIIIDLTVRTTGSAGTAAGSMEVVNQGVTGLSTLATNVVPFTSSTLATTTATKLSITYKSTATTCTCTFQTATIEIP